MREENVGHFEQGNFGIQDIRMALRVVYQNIEKFGGDRERITIMGNSAGALAVGTLLSDEAPAYSRADGWPFYRSAILQCPPVNLKMRNQDEMAKYNHDIVTG